MNTHQIDCVVDRPPILVRQPKQKRRAKVTDEKDDLISKIRSLANAPPKRLNDASVNAVQDWLDAQESALKVVNNSRSSLASLRLAEGALRLASREGRP